MRVVSRGSYPGPNLFGPTASVRAAVDFGALVDRPLRDLGPAMVDRLRHTLPRVVDEPWPGTERPIEAHLRAGPDGTLPDLAAALARGMIRFTVEPSDHVEVRRLRAGIVQIVIETEDAEIGQAAIDHALDAMRDALPAGVPAFEQVRRTMDRRQAHAAFEAVVTRYRLHGLARMMIRHARGRDIPYFRLWPGSGVVQLGHGRRRVRILRSMTDRTSVIAHEIVSDKAMTSTLLRANGIPVPEFRAVDSAAAAEAAAEEIGYPVVVKPTNAGKGLGVVLGLREAAAVRAAYAQAAEIGPVQVEREITGDDHRLLVVDGRMVAAARRLSARVVGDGRRTIRALIAALNADPRRGPEHISLMVRIVVDDGIRRTLEEQGMGLDAVPEPGSVVLLRRTANISTGGTTEDVTALVHPACRRAAERAVALAGLDICGVDMITTDIAAPLTETGGAICELNASPGMRPHRGDPGSPDVGQALLDAVLPPGRDGRIPIAAITGTNGKTTTALMVARIMRAAGSVAGIATTAGAWVDDERIAAGDRAGGNGVRMILRDTRVDVAVLECARGGLIREGLGYDRCSVGAVLNVGDDHLGEDGITDLAGLARVKRLVASSARDLLVLNAGDPLCRAMARGQPAAAIAWVAPDLVRLPAAGSAGPRHLGVCLSGQGAGARIVVRVDGSEIPVVPVAAIPATDGGRARHNVENALFATAIAWGLGAPVDAIARGLAGFDQSFAVTRGRLARLDGLPFGVIVDFGHNPGAMRAMARYAAALPVAGRRILLSSLPGNRRREHYQAFAAAAAGAFELFICTGDARRRGRAGEEVAGLVADGLRAARVDEARITVITDQAAAVDTALRAARPGDLVVMMVDQTERAWQAARTFGGMAGG